VSCETGQPSSIGLATERCDSDTVSGQALSLGSYETAWTWLHKLRPYLDELAFRFNRRRSKARGLLFHRLACQVVAVGPATYDAIVEPSHPPAQLE
jgi:hypothetical protein